MAEEMDSSFFSMTQPGSSDHLNDQALLAACSDLDDLNTFDFGQDVQAADPLLKEPDNLSAMRPSDGMPPDTHQSYQRQAVNDDLGPQYYNSYLPEYHMPDVKCRYCSSMNMECKVFRNGGNKACAACIYLFRTCSFVEDQDVGNGRIDLLHVVNEDSAQDVGLPTRIQSLYTAGASRTEINERSSRNQEKTGRFSRDVLHVLRTWLQAHADHPYPSEQEKVELGQETGLTKPQISNWLANARRRGKVVRRAPSPSAAHRTPPVNINKTVDQSHLTPFDRWKYSPPENEAPMAAIRRNAAATGIDHFASASSSLSQSMDDNSSAVSTRQQRPESSMTSFDKRTSNSNDTRSLDTRSQGSGSILSRGSSRSSYSTFAKKERRRRHRLSAKCLTQAKKPSKKPNTHRPFECTFCVDTFVTKYDWMRHEKSMHLNLEKWVCAPRGACEHDTLTNIDTCSYCGLQEPSPDHTASHDHIGCSSKGVDARTFLRKDHLRQHLRLVHNAPMAPHMENWKQVPEIVRSRCGFCNTLFNTWDQRATHLAGHFRAGVTMATWTGGWGLDPEVASCVQEAMQPSMIHVERSKTSPTGVLESVDLAIPDEQCEVASADSHNEQALEALTSVLATFVREHQAQEICVSDAMIQTYARQALYGSDDAWNQTPADDATWLCLFKQQVGLTALASNSGGQVQSGPAPAPDVATDLGLQGLDSWLAASTAGCTSSTTPSEATAPLDFTTFEASMLTNKSGAALGCEMDFDLLWDMEDA